MQTQAIRHCMALLAAMAVLLLGSCSSQFSIKGKITGLGSQNLRVVYCAGDSVVDQWVRATNGEFQATGASDQLTVVSVLDGTGAPLVQLALQNGDKVQVEGEAMQRFAITATGNDISQQWTLWVTEHRALYENSDHTALNRAIEQYVKDNRQSALSALLLLVDYFPTSQAQHEQLGKLLASLDQEACPQGLLDNYRRLTATTQRQPASLGSMLLYRQGKGLESFSPAKAPATLVWGWIAGGKHHDEAQAVKAVAAPYGDRLQVADVLMQPDSTMWASRIKADAAPWSLHYWAPDGPMHTDLLPLNVQQAPWYVVTDSLGKVRYNGASLDQASKQLRALLGSASK